MPALQAGISITAGVIALACAILLRTVGRQAWPRLTTALIVGGIMSIVGTPLGHTARRLAEQTDAWLGSFIGQWTGAAVLGLCGLVIVATLGFDLWHQHVARRTLACAAATPIVGATIPGLAGAAVIWACTAVAAVIGWPIAWAFGG